ncbi:hypothetical protein CCACVL1_22672, partial [Corchorus capsularis]
SFPLPETLTPYTAATGPCRISHPPSEPPLVTASEHHRSSD